jgi:hypothetical protein
MNPPNRTRPPPFLVWLFLMSATGPVALGCGSDEAASASGDTSPPTPMGDIKGTVVDTFVWKGVTTTVPRSPEETAIAALVPKPDGNFETIPAEIQADGSFQIKDPGASYYLKVSDVKGGAPVFYWTDARVVVLGETFGRRPDAKAITMPSTSVVIDATGLNPWQYDDLLQIDSLGAGARARIFQFEQPEHLPLGDTTVSGATFEADELNEPNLIDGSKGDVAYLTQLATRDLNGFPYSSVGKVLKPAPFTMSDGGSTKISGTFEDVPQKTLSIDWKRSKIAALAPDIHPLAAAYGVNLFIYADKATLLSNVDSGFNDITGDLTFGNPFPSDLDLTASAWAIFRYSVTLPGATSEQVLLGRTECKLPLPDSGIAVLEPVVSPVKNLKVNGQSTESAVLGAGLSPTVSWDASSTIDAAYYIVTVRKLESDVYSTGGVAIAILRTTETTVAIPPGILSEGGFYYFQVRNDNRALDLTKGPVGTAYGCSAQAFTNWVAP